ncbi:MAG: DUF2225 domain-containing protein [Schwartzia sp.]|nr:DUF2225 domain-containing protein [Schwartzia sp. (in: firmicutes)]
MNKEELLTLLNDPDICQRIFLIVKNCGRPSASPTPTDADRLAAIKEKLQRARPAQTEAAPIVHDEDGHREDDEADATETLSYMAAPKPREREAADGLGGLFGDRLAFLRQQVQKETEERLAEEKRAEEQQQEHGSAHKYIYLLERPCPVCGRTTRVIKSKSRLNAEWTDADFCVHFKDFNPYFYRVWACEHCGFTADEQRFTKPMPERTRKKLLDILREANLAMPFAEERDMETAVSYLQMAILFSELSDPSPNRRAGLWLTMAWIYRCEGEAEKEQEALGRAVELFEESLSTERYPVDKMSDSMATYLTGAIHFMRKDYDKAIPHLSRIIASREVRTSAPLLYEKARDMWQDIKRIRQS